MNQDMNAHSETESFGDYVREKLKLYKREYELAADVNVHPSTLTKWKKSKNGPQQITFENCIRFIVIFKDDPRRVFRLAGKPEYGDLYSALVKDGALSGELKAPTLSKADAELHRKLQAILDAGDEWRSGIILNVEQIYDGLIRSKKARRKRA